MRPVADGRRQAPRLLPRRIVLALAALTAVGAALVLTACGTTVDQSKIEAQVKADLERNLFKGIEASPAGEQLAKRLGISSRDKIAAVDCPSGLDVDPGTTFLCTVEFSNGRQASETLKILNKEADVRVVGLKPDK